MDFEPMPEGVEITVEFRRVARGKRRWGARHPSRAHMTLAELMSPSGHERRFRDVRDIASGSHRVWMGKDGSPDQLVLGIRIHMVLVPEKIWLLKRSYWHDGPR
jgi:hypothetical protein